MKETFETVMLEIIEINDAIETISTSAGAGSEDQDRE